MPCNYQQSVNLDSEQQAATYVMKDGITITPPMVPMSHPNNIPPKHALNVRKFPSRITWDIPEQAKANTRHPSPVSRVSIPFQSLFTHHIFPADPYEILSESPARLLKVANFLMASFRTTCCRSPMISSRYVFLVQTLNLTELWAPIDS